MRVPLLGRSARGPAYVVRAVPNLSRAVSIPAPVGGWDAISPLANMPETSAITLDNAFPQPGYIEIRRGHKTHNVTGTAAVETLIPYAATAPANDKLFAISTTAVSDVTVFTTVSASSTSPVVLSGLTNARWQHLQFGALGGNFVWMCNGVDKPRTFNGTVWATAELTGIPATSPVSCTAHKGRIWVAVQDSLSPAYLNPGFISGTAVPFDLTGIFKRGGFLQSVGSWSLDSGAGPDDLIAFISSRGEVAVYSGTDPATNFVLRGLYDMGAPVGRRCLTKVGGDLAVISVDGVLPLSQALVTDRAAALTASITKQIQPKINESMRSSSGNFGWQLTPYPRGTRAILNVPLTENTLQHQYIYNVITGAWCRFTGENANVWAVFKDRLFYGGNSGRVFEADAQGFDEGAAITVDIETAFNYLKTRGRLKQFTFARTLLTTDGQITPGMAVNVDFARDAPVTVPSVQQQIAGLWDVDLWDQGVWPQTTRVLTDWQGVAGIGYCASIHMQASIQASSAAQEKQSVTLQINGWDFQCIDGALM